MAQNNKPRELQEFNGQKGYWVRKKGKAFFIPEGTEDFDFEKAIAEYNSKTINKKKYEDETDPEQRLKNVYTMDRVLRGMNNEDAIENWLYEVEDESSDEGYESFKENAEEWDYAKGQGKGTYYYTSDEDYNRLVGIYKNAINEYAEDGIMTREYFKNQKGNWKELAGLTDEEIDFLKQDIKDFPIYGKTERSILINDYNKYDSRTGSMDDDYFTEQGRKLGMNDSEIASEIYKKHGGAESNRSTDNSIKMNLARIAKEEYESKGLMDSAALFQKYEDEFKSRLESNELEEGKNTKNEKGFIKQPDGTYKNNDMPSSTFVKHTNDMGMSWYSEVDEDEFKSRLEETNGSKPASMKETREYYDKVGKEKFYNEPNKDINEYVSQGTTHDISEDLKNRVKSHQQPANLNFVTYAGVPSNFDENMFRNNIVQSTSLNEKTADLYSKNYENDYVKGTVVKFEVEKGSNIVSTYNSREKGDTTNLHFKNQAEIILSNDNNIEYKGNNTWRISPKKEATQTYTKNEFSIVNPEPSEVTVNGKTYVSKNGRAYIKNDESAINKDVHNAGEKEFNTTRKGLDVYNEADENSYTRKYVRDHGSTGVTIWTKDREEKINSSGWSATHETTDLEDAYRHIYDYQEGKKTKIVKHGKQYKVYTKNGPEDNNMTNKGNVSGIDKESTTTGSASVINKGIYNAGDTFKTEKQYVKEKNPYGITNYTDERYEKFREAGWMTDKRSYEKGGSDYEKIVDDLREKGYKTKIIKSTTRVRGIYNYEVMYIKK